MTEILDEGINRNNQNNTVYDRSKVLNSTKTISQRQGKKSSKVKMGGERF